MAAARCMGPLSLAMTSLAEDIREIISGMVVFPVVLIKLGLLASGGGVGI